MPRRRALVLAVGLAAALSGQTFAKAGPTCAGKASTPTTFSGGVIRGTAGADVIVGSGGEDTIKGLGGNDRICALKGADTIIGGAGRDRIIGGPGKDLIVAGSGNDTVVAGSKPDEVDGGSGNDTLSGGGDGDLLYGHSGDDRLRGGGGDDILLGWTDEDAVKGGSGVDVLDGGASDDFLEGGSDFDYVGFLYGPNVGVHAELGTGQASGQGFDTFQDVEGLIGSEQGDVLVGDAAANALLGAGGGDDVVAGGGGDYLAGADGDDRLDGGVGTDEVVGGAGYDRCINDEVVRGCEADWLYIISVYSDPWGLGQVQFDPPGIAQACSGIACRAYPPGTTVTLTAEPPPGHSFVEWTGECSGSGSCVLTLDESKIVGATFRPPQTLTVRNWLAQGTVTDDHGQIDCRPGCFEQSAQYDYGTVVTLTATPEPGWVFYRWQSSCFTSEPVCAVTMTRTTTVDAEFRKLITVTVNRVGNGTVSSDLPGIDCGSDCTEQYPAYETVWLTATPDPGSTFVGWDNCEVISPENECRIYSDQDQEVTATFVP